METYCIGGMNVVKNIDLVNKILKLMRLFSSKYNFNLKPKNKLIKHTVDRKGHDKKYALSIKKLEKNLRWFPKKSFDEGLTETIESYLLELQRKNLKLK